MNYFTFHQYSDRILSNLFTFDLIQVKKLHSLIRMIIHQLHISSDLTIPFTWYFFHLLQEVSVFVFEKKTAEKLHKPRRRETVTELLRHGIRQLERYRHPRLLQVRRAWEKKKHATLSIHILKFKWYDFISCQMEGFWQSQRWCKSWFEIAFK